MQGTDELPTYQKFRQSNQFFYLTGVEVPRAILVIDGRTKSSTLFLNPRDERAERSEGPVLTPGPEAEKLTGVTSVRPRGEFAAVLAQLAGEGRTLFMPHRPEALGAATPGYTLAHAQRSLEDPWDGRLSREAAFIARVKEKAPKSRGQGSRSGARRDAARQEPARDRPHPRGDADRRPRHHGSDAFGRAWHVRIRARSRRRLRVQEAQRAGDRLLRARRRGQERQLAALSRRAERGSTTATWSSSTTRPTSSTTPPT